MVPVDDEDRVVRAPLDRRVRRDRIGAGIALVGVLERDRHLRLGAGHGDERDADRAAVPEAGAEVGVHGAGCTDRRDVEGGVRIDGQRVDPGVPDMISWKDWDSVDRRSGAGGDDQQGGEEQENEGKLDCCRLDHAREYGATADEPVDREPRRSAGEGPARSPETAW